MRRTILFLAACCPLWGCGTAQRAVDLEISPGEILWRHPLGAELWAAALDLWDDYRSPVERVPAGDSRWRWQGDWREKKVAKWGTEFLSRASGTRGAEVSISFRGTGAILVGWYLPAGGLADVFLDREPAGTIDVYPDEEDVKLDEAVWHAFGLADGEHELRLVVRGEPYVESPEVRSRGTEICLTSLVVFRG